MPHRALRAIRTFQGGGERGVGPLTLTERCRLVHDRPHQRMAKAQDRSVYPHQSDRLGGIEGSLRQLELGRRAERDRQLARLLGGGDQERLVGRRRQPIDTLGEGRTEPRGQRQRRGKRGLARELVVREREGQLEQRQRVAGGLADQPRANRRRRPRRAAIEQQVGGCAIKAAHDKVIQPRRVEAPAFNLARAEQDRHSFGDEPSSHERKRVRGWDIKPLCIVDQAQDRPRFGRGRQQRQCSRRDQEPIATFPWCQAERRCQRLALWLGDTVKLVDDRPQQAMQPGERQVRLPLDPGHAEDHHLGGTAGRSGVVEQRGLAHPGLGPDHERTALTPSGVPEQAVDHGTLGSPAEELRDPPFRLRTTRHVRWKA